MNGAHKPVWEDTETALTLALTATANGAAAFRSDAGAVEEIPETLQTRTVAERGYRLSAAVMGGLLVRVQPGELRNAPLRLAPFAPR